MLQNGSKLTFVNMKFMYLVLFISMCMRFTEIKSHQSSSEEQDSHEIKSHQSNSKEHDSHENLLTCPIVNSNDLAIYLRYYGETGVYLPNGTRAQQGTKLMFPANVSLLYLPTEDYVSFHLYSRNNYNISTILKVNDTKTLANSHFDSKKKTKIMIHGWGSSEEGPPCQVIKNNYLEADDYNVVCVDWSKIGDNKDFYVTVYQTINIGALIAKFVDFLVVQGTNLKNIHLLGHSIGAHIVGIAGSDVKSGRVSRITGLDPTIPGYEYLHIEKYTLKASDADFVDIIHTGDDVLGIDKSIGDVDFFPNGGLSCQPGCHGAVHVIETCSHCRAIQYFAKSILNPYVYVGTKCDSWKSYLEGNCENNEKNLMGVYANANIRGNFYLFANFDKLFTPSC